MPRPLNAGQHAVSATHIVPEKYASPSPYWKGRGVSLICEYFILFNFYISFMHVLSPDMALNKKIKLTIH